MSIPDSVAANPETVRVWCASICTKSSAAQFSATLLCMGSAIRRRFGAIDNISVYGIKLVHVCVCVSEFKNFSMK
jgi:hypothetical protein